MQISAESKPNSKVTLTVAELANLMAQAYFEGKGSEPTESEFGAQMQERMQFLCSDPIWAREGGRQS